LRDSLLDPHQHRGNPSPSPNGPFPGPDRPPPIVAIDPRRIRPHRTVGTPPPRTTAPHPPDPVTATPSTETATTTTPGPVRTGRTALPPPPPVRTTAPSGTIPMVHDPTGHRNSTPKAAVTTTLPVNGVTTAPGVVMKINRAAPGLVRTRGNPNPPPAVVIATTAATHPPAEELDDRTDSRTARTRMAQVLLQGGTPSRNEETNPDSQLRSTPAGISPQVTQWFNSSYLTRD